MAERGKGTGDRELLKKFSYKQIVFLKEILFVKNA